MTTPSTLTSKTVGKGHSTRMTKGREAAAKAQANAQRVADMNAQRTGLTRTAAIQYLQTHGIYSGHSRDSVEQLRELVAEHKAPATTDPLPEAADPEPVETVRTAQATGGARTHRNPRYTEAAAAKKAGARGKGRPVTDAELDAYVAGVLATDAEAQRNEELEVAYWLEKLALSRPRWVAAWDRCTAPQAATSAA